MVKNNLIRRFGYSLAFIAGLAAIGCQSFPNPQTQGIPFRYGYRLESEFVRDDLRLAVAYREGKGESASKGYLSGEGDPAVMEATLKHADKDNNRYISRQESGEELSTAQSEASKK